MSNEIKMNALAEANQTAIVEKLALVMDPEIGLDIYNLGLIYCIDLSDRGVCEVTMTFTGAGCGCIDSVPLDIQDRLTQLPEIEEVKVNIVWSPVWQLTRISRLGRITLGVNPN
ncbi:metal-sulfur cluster assembly factor [Enterococcus sp. DIV0876]|uniref:metal-sulfur cluster assembly factor n=1 Tax=Enterococcus sp. DIV0876 TaxID=2774633 RepID=UPI003D300DC6